MTTAQIAMPMRIAAISGRFEAGAMGLVGDRSEAILRRSVIYTLA